MKSQINYLALAVVLIVGFIAGWMVRGIYKPVVHVVVDDMPFMTGSHEPKPPKAPDCGTAAECLEAAECEQVSYVDSKTHKLKFPKHCANYFAKKQAAQAQTAPK